MKSLLKKNKRSFLLAVAGLILAIIIIVTKDLENIRFVYAVLSIYTVIVVIVFGVANMSNYMPTGKKENQK